MSMAPYGGPWTLYCNKCGQVTDSGTTGLRTAYAEDKWIERLRKRQAVEVCEDCKRGVQITPLRKTMDPSSRAGTGYQGYRTPMEWLGAKGLDEAWFFSYTFDRENGVTERINREGEVRLYGKGEKGDVDEWEDWDTENTFWAPLSDIEALALHTEE